MTTDALPGNHQIATIGPVTLGCMHPDARDLMDRALEGYREEVRRAGRRQSVPGFIDWLLDKSGLVRGVDKAELLRVHGKHMEEMRERLRSHPNPKWRRIGSRKCVYSLAYWFFRWSGFVDPNGNGIRNTGSR